MSIITPIKMVAINMLNIIQNFGLYFGSMFDYTHLCVMIIAHHCCQQKLLDAPRKT
jgi:hypothetical protein